MSLASTARRGPRRTNFEHAMARLPEGTLARIDAALGLGEKQSEFLRAAIEAELRHREAQGGGRLVVRGAA